MKIPKTVITFFLLFFAAVSCLPSLATDLDKRIGPSLYIDNLNIVDLNSGQIIRGRQLQIRDDKIAAINPARTPITDKNHIYHDGNGIYVMPGLIDMHVHAYDLAAFVITLSHGVTHARLMNGVKEHLVWRKELEEGSRIGSPLTVSSPIISGFKNAHMYYSVQTSAEASKTVIKFKQQGYDLIKAYGNLDGLVLKALLRDAKKQNIPVAKHGPHPVRGGEWSELLGLQSLEHVEDIYQGPLNYVEDQQKLDQTIVNLKTLGVPITPTLNIFWQLTQISEHKQSYIDSLPTDYISPIIALESKHNQVKRWLNSPVTMVEHNKKTMAYLQEITRQLYQADIRLLVGSDSGVLLSPHGLATHKEIELMQQAGVPVIAILRAATVNAAKALGKESELGVVAKGYRADLILTEQNPLENVSALKTPAFVIKHGRIFSKVELNELRRRAIDERNFWQEMDVFLQAW